MDSTLCSVHLGDAGGLRYNLDVNTPIPHSSEGRVFRLVSKEFYELFIPDQHEPEMKRAPLEKARSHRLLKREVRLI